MFFCAASGLSYYQHYNSTKVKMNFSFVQSIKAAHWKLEEKHFSEKKFKIKAPTQFNQKLVLSHHNILDKRFNSESYLQEAEELKRISLNTQNRVNMQNAYRALKGQFYIAAANMSRATQVAKVNTQKKTYKRLKPQYLTAFKPRQQKLNTQRKVASIKINNQKVEVKPRALAIHKKDIKKDKVRKPNPKKLVKKTIKKEVKALKPKLIAKKIRPKNKKIKTKTNKESAVKASKVTINKSTEVAVRTEKLNTQSEIDQIKTETVNTQKTEVTDVNVKNEYSTEEVLVSSQVVVAKNEIKTSRVIEAFNWEESVEQGEYKVWSHEGYSDETEGKWLMAKANHYWPTLYWGEDSNSNVEIPLISNNSAWMLSRESLIGTDVQQETGIIFGKVNAGWEIDFSGRSEEVIFLDKNNNVIKQSDKNKERYFILLNAEPGAHILYAHNSQKKLTAGVGVATLESTATYVDLSKPSMKTIKGTVLDGSSHSNTGVKNVQVQVIGNEEKISVTNNDGQFKIDNIVTFSNMPVYVETVHPRMGFKHRYQVANNKFNSAQLYRFSVDQVMQWTDQLEGGVSPQSGLIVAALPKISNTNNNEFFAGVHSLRADNNLTPETYSLSSGGQLEVRQALEGRLPRFLSVQVPSGFVLAEVKDQNREVVWSEMISAQKNVINVIGFN